MSAPFVMGGGGAVLQRIENCELLSRHPRKEAQGVQVTFGVVERPLYSILRAGANLTSPNSLFFADFKYWNARAKSGKRRHKASVESMPQPRLTDAP